MSIQLGTMTSNGGASITSYALYWDARSDGALCTAIIGERSSYNLALSVVKDGLTSGVSYQFKYRVKMPMAVALAILQLYR